MGKHLIIKDGQPIKGYEIRNDTSVEELDELYKAYKHSVPNGIHYYKPYFKALDADELSDADMITGANREQAKFDLELAVLEGILNGSLLSLFTDPKQWFWQSQSDKEFIILREWIEPKGA
jgi:hypothetical protein